MPSSLTITKTDGPVQILHLAGKLDGETQSQLVEEARKQQAAGTHRLLIDLAQVEFIASAGLGALQNLYRMFTPDSAIQRWNREHPGEPYKSEYMKLAAAAPSVYYVLNIAGFLQNIPIYPDVEAALKSFGQ